MMLDDVGSSNDCERVFSADEHQPLLQKGNIHTQHDSIDGPAEQDLIRDESAGKDLQDHLFGTWPLQGDGRSRSYAWKTCATSISFLVVGMNTSASGVCGSTLQLESGDLLLALG